MNNPQHYQTLAHALHPPPPSSPSYPIYKSKANHSQNREEEEEDDDDDPDDANRTGPDGQPTNPSPPPTSSNGNAQGIRPDPPNEPTQEPERKRKPGRPRGSKNRKPRAVSQGTTRHDTHLSYQPTGVQHLAIPQPSDPNAQSQTQQFCEFQWRILNLCAEFYGAAEELVKSTSPIVLSQCYQLGPGSSNDPIKMLTEAKTVCDNLLANPSRLAMNPPTSTYHHHHHHQAPPAPPPTSTQSNSNPSTSTSKPTTPMITNPQSFVVSLGAQTPYPHAQYPMFTASTTPYPTTYYQYSYPPPPTTAFYPQQPIMAATQPQLQTQSPGPTSQPSAGTLSSITSTGLLNQGAWSDEETEKLKKLAEESRTFNQTGEIDWDWVVTQYGSSRTRHQILIKATALGLKESSSRGVKRRRETEDDAGPSSNVNPASASPAQSNATSTTPVDSPALQHQQRPPASRASLSSTSSNLPWPMPTVAVNTPSPVITTPTLGQDQQRTSYYRPRPAQDAGNPLYMYNGTGSRLNKENGK